MREIHAKLVTNTRGGNKMPGEFRTSQNWIGGTRPGNARFVPPPPERLMEVLGAAFEMFLHDDKTKLLALIKAALAHVQFETIHPFLDGNGRLGRLLITATILASGKSTTSTLAVHAYMQQHPVTSTTRIKEACSLSLPTVLRSLATLEALGVIKEVTGRGAVSPEAPCNYAWSKSSLSR